MNRDNIIGAIAFYLVQRFPTCKIVDAIESASQIVGMIAQAQGEMSATSNQPAGNVPPAGTVTSPSLPSMEQQIGALKTQWQALTGQPFPQVPTMAGATP